MHICDWGGHQGRSVSLKLEGLHKRNKEFFGPFQYIVVVFSRLAVNWYQINIGNSQQHKPATLVSLKLYWDTK